jgi:hypothetical protein
MAAAIARVCYGPEAEVTLAARASMICLSLRRFWRRWVSAGMRDDDCALRRSKDIPPHSEKAMIGQLDPKVLRQTFKGDAVA